MPLTPHIAAASCVGLLIAASGACAQLTFTPLAPIVSNTNNFGNGVSGSGLVAVGDSSRANGGTLAAKWFGATSQSLGTLSGYQTSVCVAANTDGSVIVGTSSLTPSSNSPTRATRWVGSTSQDLGLLPNGFSSRAWGVSGDGNVVVGICTQENLSVVAFRWSQATGMQSLGTFEGRDVPIAFDANHDGSVIVGNLSIPSEGFRWTSEGGIQPLGSVTPGAGSTAQGVSADGSVVVGASGFNNARRAMRWTSELGMQSLGLFPGATTSSATDTNDDGSVIVGSCNTPNGQRAFVWTPSTGMLDLTQYLSERIFGLDGWSLQTANGISDDGSTIVGTGTVNNVSRAYRITGLSFEIACPPCAADYDSNGGVDGGDLAAFVSDFESGAQCADVDQNGGVDGGDLGVFFLAFEAGGC